MTSEKINQEEYDGLMAEYKQLLIQRAAAEKSTLAKVLLPGTNERIADIIEQITEAGFPLPDQTIESEKAVIAEPELDLQQREYRDVPDEERFVEDINGPAYLRRL